MRRFFFTFFAAASLILFAAVAVIWVRSYWVANDVNTWWNRAAYQDDFQLHLLISRGGIRFEYYSRHIKDPNNYAEFMSSNNSHDFPAVHRTSAKATEYPADPNQEKVAAGFENFHNTQSYSDAIFRKGIYVAPLWSLASLLALLPAAWLILAWRRRRNLRWFVGHCARCGYDLRASPEICAECGAPSRLTRVNESFLSRLRRRTLLAAGLGAAFVPCLALLLVFASIHQWRKDYGAFQKFQHVLDLGRVLCEAAQQGNNDIVIQNLNAGARIDARCESNGNIDIEYPPLLAAVDHGHLDTVKLLLARGANVNARGFRDKTPLDGAVETNNLELVRLLIDNGADVNARNSQQSTPLASAAWLKTDENAPIALFLIAHGADVNAKTSDGHSVLEIAARFDRFKLAKQLIAHGADVNTVDHDGDTPLKVAREFNFRLMENLLLKNGAKQ